MKLFRRTKTEASDPAGTEPSAGLRRRGPLRRRLRDVNDGADAWFSSGGNMGNHGQRFDHGFGSGHDFGGGAHGGH